MSFQFDTNVTAEVAVSGEAVEFGSNVDLTIPKKPEKKVVERAAKVEKKAKRDPPPLTQNKYYDVGANLTAMIRHRVRNEQYLDEMYDAAWERVKKLHGIGPAPLCSDTLSSHFSPATDTTKAVTFAAKYKESDEGKKLLENYREHDNEARRVNDMFIKAYLKSTECADLYSQWLDHKNPAIVSKQVYYIVNTLAKAMISGFYRDCINHRCSEPMNSPRSFEVSVKTVESMCSAIVSGTRRTSTYPLSAHFATKVLGMTSEFAEKSADKSTADKSSVESTETPAEFVVYECGVNSNEVRYMTSIVAEIISRVNRQLNDKNKAAQPEAQDILFRTSQQFKQLLGCAAYDFCLKVISGACEYERRRDPAKGFKVDVEDISAYLINLSYMTNNVKNYELDVTNIEKFISNAESDFEKLEDFTAEKNIADRADKMKITVDQLKVDKEAKEARRLVEEEKKLANLAGLTVEAFRVRRAENINKRKIASENAKKRVADEKLERSKKFQEKLAKNDLRLKHGEVAKDGTKKDALLARLSALRKFEMIAPPQIGVKMISGGL